MGIEDKNKKIIDSLVTNHFSLEKKSLERFHKNLYEPDLDPIYSNIVGEDLRAYFPIDENNLYLLDIGWKKFEPYFNEFIKEFNVKYENFRQNRIFYKKNEYKLNKLIKKFYAGELDIKPFFSSYSEITLVNILNEIGVYKAPKSNIYMVLSCNFADWFLCSTGESWSSCLNLESDYEGCYWAGLPGTIIDKNRCMIYITDGQKKEYNGIVVDKIISRTWGLLDTTNHINLIKFYPSIILPTSNILSKIDNVINLNFSFESKYAINFLRFKENYTCFIYKDYSKFNCDCNGNYKISYCSNGTNTIFNGKDEIINSDLFYCTCGLNDIIKKQKEIFNYTNATVICYNCDETFSEENCERDSEGNAYCRDCFNSFFSFCDECDKIIEIDSINYNNNPHGNILCTSCFDKKFINCDNCNYSIKINDSIEIENKIFCAYCAEAKNKKMIINF